MNSNEILRDEIVGARNLNTFLRYNIIYSWSWLFLAGYQVT